MNLIKLRERQRFVLYLCGFVITSEYYHITHKTYITILIIAAFTKKNLIKYSNISSCLASKCAVKPLFQILCFCPQIGGSEELRNVGNSASSPGNRPAAP